MLKQQKNCYEEVESDLFWKNSNSLIILKKIVMAKKTSVASKKRKNIKLPVGKLYVKTTFNNTLVTLTDTNWNKVSWGWTWTVWFKWTKQNTPYAAEMLWKDIIYEAKNNFWLKEIGIHVKWLWLWRDWVFKAINDIWWVDITYIKEETPIQFGWCKRKRPKRN